jgi:hypothetical protein
VYLDDDTLGIFFEDSAASNYMSFMKVDLKEWLDK